MERSATPPTGKVKTASTPPPFTPYKCTYTKREEWVNTGTQDVMVFYPTLEEIADFPTLVRKIEQSGAHLASGICKIVPPKGWTPRPSRDSEDYADADDVRIYSPVKETIEGMAGSFTRSIKVYRKKMTVREFRKLALTKDMVNPKPELTLAELERHYWRSILYGEPIYGADSPGSLFEENVKEFNMGNLGTILDLLDEQQIKISGVNTPFLYFGMWKTTFPWHVEDMDLYSINYLHFGEPKFWYAIPSQAAEKFERLACQQFPDGPTICKAFLRHKLYIISPSVLKSHSIPYGTMVQYPNEIVITFPKGYHMGFNVGYNCAEAINFALERWIDFGKNATLCYCRSDGVEIDMQPFMRKYRPDEFEAWYDYWYGERHASIKDDEKARRKQIAQNDPIMDAIYTERQKRLSHAKRTVKNLWSTQPVNLFNEKEYNAKRGRIFPHCAVCQYFVPRRILASQKPPRAIGQNLPKTSRRFVTDQLFYKDELLETDSRQMVEDELWECSNCRVVVHKRCYPDFDGFPNASSSINSRNFRCMRCHEREDTAIRAASCALCELRGGALVEMRQTLGSLQHFVHVICAIMHTSTRFLEPERRRAVNRPPPKWLLAAEDDASNGSPQRDGGKFCCQREEGSIELKISSSERVAHSPPPAEKRRKFELSSPPHLTPYLAVAPPSTSSRLSLAERPHPQVGPAGDATNANGNAISSTLSTSVSKSADCTPQSMPLSTPIVSFTQRPQSSLNETPKTSQYLPPPAAESTSATSVKAGSPATLTARYQCEVCQGVSVDLIQCDICVSTEEHSAAASLRYHITCATLADMTFERREIAPYAVAVCPFHNSYHVVAKPDNREITAGERVIVALDADEVSETLNSAAESASASSSFSSVSSAAETSSVHPKGCPSALVSKGRVMKSTECLYCTVDFLDGSVSTDLYPNDIRRCECHYFGCKNGSHLSGALVYVQWHDGKMYEAYYRGKAPMRKYLVELDTPLVARRNSISWNMLSASQSRATAADENENADGLADLNTSFDSMKEDDANIGGGPTKPSESNESVESIYPENVLEVNQDEVFTLDEPLPEEVRVALLKRRQTTLTSSSSSDADETIKRPTSRSGEWKR